PRRHPRPDPDRPEGGAGGAGRRAGAGRGRRPADDPHGRDGGGLMKPGEACLLRLYMNADDRFQRRPLYEAVVTKARELGLAGASVCTAEMGYGYHRVVHDAMSEYSFVGSPVVAEVVDSPERIRALLAELRAMVVEGLVTVSPVRVARYDHPPG